MNRNDIKELVADLYLSAFNIIRPSDGGIKAVNDVVDTLHNEMEKLRKENEKLKGENLELKNICAGWDGLTDMMMGLDHE